MVVGGTMSMYARYLYSVLPLLLLTAFCRNCRGMKKEEKKFLRLKTQEMFRHAYINYMEHAYPADELMPLSCKGRYRGVELSRGDIDDALGNFSLTLIDALDSLVILGEVDEFERAVHYVINDVTFDTDIVVSLFETNIRVLGGLLGGHLMALHLRKTRNIMRWYNDELLHMAYDLGHRLLPAFNTSTGMPYPRVNLRYGVKHELSRTGDEKDTCTACAGSILLEFSTLSRLTGNTVFEEKAVQAMDYLWQSRHRASDLVGTVINIHNGDWVRRESGVGAGIDSYYEYLLKGYIMLGDETYLERFNKHYTAVMKYISNGPMMLDVHMHKPQTTSRNFMDALLAFWPGLQVLKGDVKSAIQMHEMLYQIIQRHNFLPEAFTTDFRVHWAQHPLRPEFVESTYFLYKATGDPYYLQVGKSIIDNLDKHARVPCGFAAIKDVTTGAHEDQMDSYVLAETFKYLYLLFSEKEDLLLDIDSFVFTTEAHLMPLFLSTYSAKSLNHTKARNRVDAAISDNSGNNEADYTCPSSLNLFKSDMEFAHNIRHTLKGMVEEMCPKPQTGQRPARLKAADFVAGNSEHMKALSRMGIHLVTMNDGRVQLLHISSEAASSEDSSDGITFMHDMIKLSKHQNHDAQQEPRVIQFVSHPYLGSEILQAGPAQFGFNFKSQSGVQAQLAFGEPFRACHPLTNRVHLINKIALVERGDCMFVDKARHIQNAGAVGGIVFDNNSQSSFDSAPLFSMSGDGQSDIAIPLVFLFGVESQQLVNAFQLHKDLIIYIGQTAKHSSDILMEYFLSQDHPTATVDETTNSLQHTTDVTIRQTVIQLLARLNLNALSHLIDTVPSSGSDVSGLHVQVLRSHEVNSEQHDDLKKIGAVFSILLHLLQQCTNYADLTHSSNMISDALTRLVENVFTNGRMGYGIQAEIALGELSEKLVINDRCGNIFKYSKTETFENKSPNVFNKWISLSNKKTCKATYKFSRNPKRSGLEDGRLDAYNDVNSEKENSRTDTNDDTK